MRESHNHSAAQAGARRLSLVLFLTAAYMGVELAGAVVTGSLALLADVGHVLIDVTGLSLALIAIHFAARPATAENTYGFHRS